MSTYRLGDTVRYQPSPEESATVLPTVWAARSIHCSVITELPTQDGSMAYGMQMLGTPDHWYAEPGHLKHWGES